jgi:hypothetical protein
MFAFGARGCLGKEKKDFNAPINGKTGNGK